MQADSPDTTTDSPLTRARYMMTEPHLSGFRIVLGFDTRDEADAAHAALAPLLTERDAGSAGASRRE